MNRLICTLLLCLAPVWLQGQVTLYAASGNGNHSSLYRVDPTNASSTLIGAILVGGSPVTVTALAAHPTTGQLYGVTGSEYAPSRQLFTIDPVTLATTVIGTIGTASNQNASDITFAANGTLYGWTTRGGPLITLGLGDAARTAVGSATNGTQGNGLTFTPDGTLYLAGPTSPGSLYTVDTVTGAITAVAALSNVPVNFGTSVNAMASDPNGVLYAVGRSSGAQLVTIDRVTGAMTTVGVLSFGEADALAFVPVPEPATWLTLGLGGALLWLRSRRRPGTPAALPAGKNG